MPNELTPIDPKTIDWGAEMRGRGPTAGARRGINPNVLVIAAAIVLAGAGIAFAIATRSGESSDQPRVKDLRAKIFRLDSERATLESEIQQQLRGMIEGQEEIMRSGDYASRSASLQERAQARMWARVAESMKTAAKENPTWARFLTLTQERQDTIKALGELGEPVSDLELKVTNPMIRGLVESWVR